MTLEQRIIALAQGIATTVKGVNGKIGDLATLNTTQKASVVAALNELQGAIAGAGASIDDVTPSTSTTYSSSKIDSQINAAIAALINGADISSDTLSELADQITALAQADNGLVSALASQSFTAPQQAQARTNIGAAAASDLTTLTTNVGNTDHDFVADFNTQYLA